MKTRHPVILLTLLFSIPFFLAAGQSLRNGDLSRGSAIWSGDRRVIDDPDDPSNKILEMALKRNQKSSFYQLIDTAGVSFIISFRVKPSDGYKGDGIITLRCTRADRSFVWQNFNIRGKSWQTISWPFTEINGSRKVNFSIETERGEGKLLFDDFSIKKK